MKLKIRNYPSPRSIAQSSKCSNDGVFVISLQVGYCWLWSLIFQIQRYYSVVFVPQVYCTRVPPILGFKGCVLANIYVDPWYWINRSIFPWYFSPIKESIVTRLCIALQHCKQSLCLCGRNYESMKRKCSGFDAGCIPSSFRM